MGNYIKNEETNKIIKIGTLGETFFSRKTLTKFRELGYKGYFNGEFNDELDETLSDEGTLFGFCNEAHFIEWGLDDKIFYLPASNLPHDPVIVNQVDFKVAINVVEDKGIKLLSDNVLMSFFEQCLLNITNSYNVDMELYRESEKYYEVSKSEILVRFNNQRI